ncbi:uncharacterized protein LOC125240945 [Leguminivora glycinivorella]|uniref:uncharacterized protein LOC125240945 n=1 Tax=Leguminivora glycinivorella TaxID=1035111 RepID=UPI002010C4F7|nr:uncharacterized protein LOC125240945 [Leguminivora glycinivorella]
MGDNTVLVQAVLMFFCWLMRTTESNHELRDVENIFSKCKKHSAEFDDCMKQALNDLRPYFKRGIPEIGVAPFDPHTAKEVKQTRTILGIIYTIILRDVYEYGWTQSTVTKFKTNWANTSIIYSQYFPEKYLEGRYEFMIGASGLAMARTRSGHWNLTLRAYAQTTRVARRGEAVRVRVEIDRIGDMNLHITNLFSGTGLEQLVDGVINTFWKPGFGLVKPMINDLVSSAFTNIWSESFKLVNVQNLIKN